MGIYNVSFSIVKNHCKITANKLKKNRLQHLNQRLSSKKEETAATQSLKSIPIRPIKKSNAAIIPLSPTPSPLLYNRV